MKYCGRSLPHSPKYSPAGHVLVKHCSTPPAGWYETTGAGLGLELNCKTIDAAHFHPAVEVKSTAAAKPLPPQLRDGGLKVSADHKAHVMELNMATVDAAAEHHQEQPRCLRRAHAGMLLKKPTHRRRRRFLR